MEKKVTYEELKPVVEGVARQYSKDLVLGRGFSRQKYEDLVQDLWVKAYDVLSDYPNAPINYISKCLWNYATDNFRSSMKCNSIEWSVDPREFTMSQKSDTYDTSSVIEDVVSDASCKYCKVESYETNELVELVLNIAKSCNNDMYKYCVAKLKLNGYLPESFESSITVKGLDPNEVIDNYDVSQDQYVLQEIFGFKNSKTGGSGSFKKKKRDFRLLLLDQLGILDSYLTWYEVQFSYDGLTDSKWVKAYTKESAMRIVIDDFKNTDIKILKVVSE